MNNSIITVSQLNRYVKSLFDENSLLKEVYIKGEISNFVNHYRSGHMYFSLKDDKSCVKAVMFSSYAKMLKFEPENGLSVIVRAGVSLYEKDGTYQIYVYDMQPDGLGALNLAYEQLKEKLEKEGLFSIENKKRIPDFPQNIGVVTAKNAAALQDILNILKRTYPIGTVRHYPVFVQGKEAAGSIVRTIDYICREKVCDVIILARGGGSLEDLWAFNEESVVRAVANSTVPIVTGIGHETDYTLSDFASDLRAETPSAAASHISSNITELYLEMDNFESKVLALLQNKVNKYRELLDEFSSARLSQAMLAIIENKKNEILDLHLNLKKNFNGFINFKQNEISHISQILSGLNPLSILNRGYTITKKVNGDLIENVKIGDEIITQTAKAVITSKIEDITFKDNSEENIE